MCSKADVGAQKQADCGTNKAKDCQDWGGGYYKMG